jgi:hypothetical protein
MTKLKEAVWLTARAVTGVLCMMVTFRGALSIYGMDFRINPILSATYCTLPTLSIFVFALVKRPRVEFLAHLVIAAGYLVSFSMLNWRTCAELGYCTTVDATVWETFCVRPVLYAWGVACLSALTILLDHKPAARAARP